MRNEHPPGFALVQPELSAEQRPRYWRTKASGDSRPRQAAGSPVVCARPEAIQWSRQAASATSARGS